MPTRALALRARLVIPVSSDPIEHGWVTIEDGRIAAVGQVAPAGARVDDLGDVALLPGLINAHAHLNLSDFDQPLGNPGVRLADWIPQLLASRANRLPDARHPIMRGLHECLHAGCVAVADITPPNWPEDEVGRHAVRVAAFMELIAPTPQRVGPALDRAREHLKPRPGACWQRGLSPHAPYTVRLEALDAAMALAKAAQAPVAMHLAESMEEIDLLATGDGPLFDMLASLGAWSPGLVSPPSRPMDYLRRLAEAPRALVIHGNYLDANEWAYLAERRERMSVVYCPRSHAHFGHAAYPLANMLAAGVNVCLGTDSRASAPDLSPLAEMRFAARRHPDVTPATIVALCTLAAARALGCAEELGSVEPGKRADLTAVALPPDSAGDPYRMLLDGGGQVVASWIDGCLTQALA
ncbi:MAG: amidohydrolase family protein [Patescibacteria group bacterium]|nr:amidohydrolase family protein [Patescibacteria group bacterium]